MHRTREQQENDAVLADECLARGDEAEGLRLQTQALITGRNRWQSLVLSFPTLRDAASRGVMLISALDLLAALGVTWDDAGDRWVTGARAAWVGTGSMYAMLFCLDVWNINLRAAMPVDLREWSIVEAFARWDDEHRAAALAWFADPFQP